MGSIVASSYGVGCSKDWCVCVVCCLDTSMVIEMVCCSTASQMAVWSCWSILSNSSVQHTPWEIQYAHMRGDTTCTHAGRYNMHTRGEIQYAHTGRYSMHTCGEIQYAHTGRYSMHTRGEIQHAHTRGDTICTHTGRYNMHTRGDTVCTHMRRYNMHTRREIQYAHTWGDTICTHAGRYNMHTHEEIQYAHTQPKNIGTWAGNPLPLLNMYFWLLLYNTVAVSTVYGLLHTIRKLRHQSRYWVFPVDSADSTCLYTREYAVTFSLSCSGTHSSSHSHMPSSYNVFQVSIALLPSHLTLRSEDVTE